MTPTRRHLLTAAGLGLAAAAAAPRAWAQAAPGLKIVVPYAPGGAGDTLARKVAERVGVLLGERVLVDNKPGGGTVIGTQAALQAPADGQTLLFVAASYVINPQLMSKVPYDPARDFVPVALMASNPHLLVASPTVPAGTLREFTAWAKSRQGKATFASFGNGSSGHLGFELLRKAAGLEMIHVPYKGGGPAMQDLLGGQVDSMLTDLPQAVPQVKAGKLKAIAVASAARSPALPEVPTLKEAGLGEFVSQSWYGLVMRAGSPPEAVTRLGNAVLAALRDPEVKAGLEAVGLDVIGANAADFGEFMRKETARYGEAIKMSGAKID